MIKWPILNAKSKVADRHTSFTSFASSSTPRARTQSAELGRRGGGGYGGFYCFALDP
jgi:hypothetical protein